MAIQFIPNLLNKAEVDHINNIVDDNRLENLQWLTQLENLDKRHLTTNTGHRYICLHNNIYHIIKHNCFNEYFHTKNYTLQDAINFRDMMLN